MNPDGKIKKFILSHVKGGVMLFSLVISFLVLLTVSSIISINYYYTIRYEYNVQLQKLNDNIESAVLLATSGLTTKNSENELIDLYGSGRDTVHVKTWQFGVLDGFEISGFYKNVSMGRKAITAYVAGENSTFYIADHSREIAMAGKVELYGKVYLPKAGYRSSSLGGSFLVGNPINGVRMTAEQTLPELNGELRRKIENMSGNIPIDSVLDLAIFNSADSIHNSFSNKTVHVFLSGNTTLKNKILNGNIVIHCKGKLKIEKSCLANDIVIVAPVIKFEDECTFSGQVFATDSIVTGEQCTFNYPSIFVIAQQQNSPAHLGLGKKNNFTGSIIGIRDEKTINIPFNLRIEDESIVNGQIYFPGPAALAGDLNGEFYFDHVLTHTSSSVNDNFLFNVTVNKDKLHPDICLLNLLDNTKASTVKPGILKWIW
jgi:hypothetical protein